MAASAVTAGPAGAAEAVSLPAPETRLSETGRGAAISSESMPVATTETRILSLNPGSKVEPKMMLASGSTSSRIRFAASSTSKRVNRRRR